MKLLILSDSHRHCDSMRLAVQEEAPSAVIHLGDHDADALQLREEFPNLQIYSLSGNCDRMFPVGVDTLCHDFAGVRVFAAHGHQYNVKYGIFRFYMAAAEQDARVALFGHTHAPYCEEYNGIWLLNPGACGEIAPSYGVVCIDGDTLSCEIKHIRR